MTMQTADYQSREQRQWDAEAHIYDDCRRDDPIYSACVEAAVSALDAKPGDFILDAGCGTGMVLRHVLRPGIRAVAYDLSPESLRVCQQAMRGQAVTFLTGDLSNLPFDPGYFGRVLCANTLQHVPTRELRIRCLAELARVVKPGGRVVVTTHNLSVAKKRMGWAKEKEQAAGKYQYVYRYEADELAADIASAGLRIESLTGAGLNLPYRWKLSRLSRALERYLRRTAWSARHGHMLVLQMTR
jgi:Methylase involved in ubiquinone/menaquinone biosynthesis